jgi:hypothetical protein
VTCERVQEIVSAHMDGAFVPRAEIRLAEVHARGCVACRAFARRSSTIRTAVRIQPAETVPDLTEPIMAAIARERAHPPRGRHMRTRPHARGRFARMRPLLAATLAGAVIGSLVVGGPWQRPSTRPVAAAAVARGVREMARSVDAFHGRYRIVERGLSPELPERAFDMDLAFLAPQRFRLDVRDRTTYPSAAWTPTDLTYIENVATTYASGPPPCPGDLPMVCLPTRTTVSHRSGFSAAAPLPADLIVPISTFDSTLGVRVVGQDEVDGRPAVHVEMSFARASPLFPFLRAGGTWRPFFGGDLVVLWLDEASWFPLRYEVFPSRDSARRAWEMRFGLPVESPDEAILDVTGASFSTEGIAPSLFEIPGGTTADEIAPSEAAGRLGYVPATPSASAGLDLVSVVVPHSAAAASPRSLLVYADGLDYLRLGESPRWRGPGPFGPIDARAQTVAVGHDGVGFYEPANADLGRRLAIHAADTDLYLETNLSRRELLRIASSLPVRGRALPRAWRMETAGSLTVERIPVHEALSVTGLAHLVSRLPGGYVVASADRASVRGTLAGVTFTLRQPSTDATGPPLTLHVERRDALPVASSSEQSRVSVGGAPGRWTPSRSLLEWMDGRWYRSLQGVLDLRSLLAIATTISSGTPP